jgi:hypothetical protein
LLPAFSLAGNAFPALRAAVLHLSLNTLHQAHPAATQLADEEGADASIRENMSAIACGVSKVGRLARLLDRLLPSIQGAIWSTFLQRKYNTHSKHLGFR